MINLGIIGVGRMGKVHTESISNYVRQARIKAVSDPALPDETVSWLKEMGIENIYTDNRKIFDDPEITAVLICSPTDTHVDICLEAIAAGKHIFCEKPIALTLDRVREIERALEGKDLIFQVGFHRRFDHNFNAMRDCIQRGDIGDVRLVNITSRDPAPPHLAFVKASGGLFLDMMIHDFDMLGYLTGDEVEELYVNADCMVDEQLGALGDVDTAAVMLKMKSGAIATITNCRQASYGHDQRAEALGSKGMVHTENDRAHTATVSNELGVHSAQPLYFFLERYLQAYAIEIKAFVHSVADGEPVAVTLKEGLKPLIIGLAAKKALAEGRTVKISEMTY